MTVRLYIPRPFFRHANQWRLVMKEYLQFYINGAWVDPVEAKTLEVINPATEEAVAKISLGGMVDVDKAVAAAYKRAKELAN